MVSYIVSNASWYFHIFLCVVFSLLLGDLREVIKSIPLWSELAIEGTVTHDSTKDEEETNIRLIIIRVALCVVTRVGSDTT